MPYILNKTNGTELTTVQDASLDLTTDLAFVGKNYAGYGETQNENFLKLLENFSNVTAPGKPIDGQLWYDSVNKKLNVYNSEREAWKKIGNLEVESETNIQTKEPTRGDLWFNTDNDQLNVYNGTEFIVVGPPVGSDIRAQWRGDFEFNSPDSKSYNIKAIIGASNDPVALVSAEPYTLDDYRNSTTLPTYPVRTDDFVDIRRGITLVGAVTATNAFGVVYASSRKEMTGLAEDSFFWGTAAEALHSLSATTSTYSAGISYKTTNSTDIFLVPFVSSNPSSSSDFFVDPDTSQGLRYQPSSGILYAVASSALYADIAERYYADTYYEPGTVLVIGGANEVTICHKHGDVAVAGIVSKHPAYRMNEGVGTDETHPHIALKGRVPCKVIGPVKKGDLLVTRSYPGYAEKATDHDSPHAIIGRALEDFNGVKGLVEVKV